MEASLGTDGFWHKAFPDVSGMEHLYFVVANDEVREFSLKAGSLYDVVVNPMVIAAPWFAKQDAVVFEAVLVQPSFGNSTVLFSPGSKKGNDVSFLEPFVDDLQGIRVGRNDGHPLWFFVGHVVANGAINVNQEVFLLVRQQRADGFPFFVEGCDQFSRKFFALHN